jgi:hypothetical protein
MARWLAQLSGDRVDLEEFSRAFPDGDIHVVEIDKLFFVTGNALDALSDATTVRSEAKRLVSLMAGALGVADPHFRAPTVENVVREDDDGKRNFTVFAEPIVIRARVHAPVVSTSGLAPTRPKLTAAQSIIAAATGSKPLQEAVTLWAEAHTWPRLYRVLEAIEQHLGTSVNAAALCSAAQRSRFTQTANNAEAAGVDARHATGQFQAPKNPMTHDEAEAFIRGLLHSVLG